MSTKPPTNTSHTELTIGKYTVKWDGTQWVVKCKLASAKNEVLVGYYAYLPSALYFGVVHHESTGMGKGDLPKLVERLEKLWDEIREEYPRPA